MQAGEHRRHIGAGAEDRALTERNLAGIDQQEVQKHRDGEVDADETQDVDPVHVAGHVGADQRDADDGRAEQKLDSVRPPRLAATAMRLSD